MTASGEMDITKIPAYEPKSPGERIANQTIHERITKIVPNVQASLVWRDGKLFSNKNDPLSNIKILLVNMFDPDTAEWSSELPNGFKSPASKIVIHNESSRSQTQYFFDIEGKGLKVITEEVESEPDEGEISPIDPKGYNEVHHILQLVESGVFTEFIPEWVKSTK